MSRALRSSLLCPPLPHAPSPLPPICRLDNILIADGNYKLADFGSALLLPPDQPLVSVPANRAAYSVSYAAPEIYPALTGGLAVYSRKTDTFALGSVLAVLMTGRLLTAGTMWQGYSLSSGGEQRVWSGFDTPAFPPLPPTASASEVQLFEDLGFIVRELRTVDQAARPGIAELIEMPAFRRVKYRAVPSSY